MSICNAKKYYRIKNPDIQNCRITNPAERNEDEAGRGQNVMLNLFQHLFVFRGLRVMPAMT